MGSTPTNIPPDTRSLIVRGNPCCDTDSNTPAQLLTARLVALAGAELVAGKVDNEALRREALDDIRHAESKLIRDFLENPPRSAWLGTQSEVLDLISGLGVTAAAYPDETLRNRVLEIGAQVLELSSSNKR